MSHDIVPVAAVDCDLIATDWDFAATQAVEIDRQWAVQTARKPELFNGPVLLLRHGAIVAEASGALVFRGACFETDFKTFLAWRERGFPADGVRNIFSMAALESADGAFILGEMAPHTASAGSVYFPSGTPDRSDVIGHKVDIDGSARRELVEETGLDPDTLAFDPGLTLVIDGARLCCMKRVRSPETAETLVARIHAFLAADPKPEFSRMHVVRQLADITPTMPGFVTAYLRGKLGTVMRRQALLRENPPR